MNLLNVYLIEYARHYYGLFGNISQLKLLAFHKYFFNFTNFAFNIGRP